MANKDAIESLHKLEQMTDQDEGIRLSLDSLNGLPMPNDVEAQTEAMEACRVGPVPD